jgi:hypothetical protein
VSIGGVATSLPRDLLTRTASLVLKYIPIAEETKERNDRPKHMKLEGAWNGFIL